MSKKGGVMDSWFQLYNLPRIFIARNRYDCLDHISELVDFRLSLPENLVIISHFWKQYVY